MDPDDGMEDEGPFPAWLPPDDRLWRHPSELGGASPSGLDPTKDFDAIGHLGDFDGTQDFDISRLNAEGGRYAATPADAAAGAGSGEADNRDKVSARAGHGLAMLVRSGPVRTWTIAVVAGVVGALLASGVSMATGDFGNHTTVQESVRVAPTDTVALAVQPGGTPAAPNWPSVGDTVAASVVAILTSSGAAGSGVLYATRAGRTYILTTDDLVGGTVEVTFNSGEQEAARLVSTDPASGLALISVAGEHPAIPTFGSVSELRAAESLLAVSGDQPEGMTPVPLSVTSVDVAATISDDQTLVGMLAVTGSSATTEGGAIVDSQGHVVAITTAFTDTDGDPGQTNTSYAIPIDVAAHVAYQLLRDQSVTHPYLGVLETEDLSSPYAREFGVAGGAVVETVAPGSPAAQAGIGPNDVITSMNSTPVTSSGGMVSTLCDFAPGTTVTIRYLHQGKSEVAKATVGELPVNIEDPDGD